MKREKPEQSTREAAEWLVRQRADDLSSEERAQFAEWLRSSPANIREYLAASEIWENLARVDPAKHLSVDVSAAPTTVVPLRASPPAATAEAGGPGRDRTVRMAAALVAATVVAALLWVVVGSQPTGAQRVETAVGEQRSLALPDGSVVALNTDSAVRVELSPVERRVELERGEVFFDVARDPRRPFLVTVGDVVIRVVGTRFNVQQNEDVATVTVLEGKVTVGQAGASGAMADAGGGPAGAPARPGVLVLKPGQQASFGQVPVVETREVNTSKVVAWTERRLVFDGDTLAEILAEFNRYNLPRLAVSDPALAELRLTGVFRANDPDSLIEFLRQTRDIRVVERPDGTRDIQAGGD